MAHYLKTGNFVRIISEDDIEISNRLPAANYIVQFDKQAGEYYLEKIAPFELPTKMYGDVTRYSNRIITTYHTRSGSTGVLLTGEKGSGKSMLAKNVSHLLLKDDIATVVINECHYGDIFNKFIQRINQPCVIMFDEFEKIYNFDKQEQILTLLDGVFPTKKLFMFTTNDTHRINSHLCNRPGRVFYTIKHAGLEDSFIREFCEDNLDHKCYIDEICKLAMLFGAFNFDMLKALIEEMNRYNETPTQAMEILNAIPDDDSNHSAFDVELTVDGVHFGKDMLDDDGYWAGNPVKLSGFTIEYRNPEYDDNDSDNHEPYWKEVFVSPKDLIKADAMTGSFLFKNERGHVVELTKRKLRPYKYEAF